MTASDLWTRCLETIRDETEHQSYQTWFEPTRGVELTDDAMKIEVPNRFFADWLEEHYMGLVRRAVEENAGRVLDPVFQVAHKRRDEYEPVSIRREVPPPLTTAAAHECQLNPRYTFSTFVVGNSNRFAQAATMAVAEAPADSYNPLFIYGGVGLGKTHLMQAIGQYVREKRPELSVYYVSSETFMNELITAIQRGSTLEFRDKYRSKDVLLIDDVQFLAGKESTQEEFFHTFNALYLAHKQIVMTSDRPPKQIATLEERLVSRFESGLVTDVQPPDLETRIAILQEKAELDGISIPNDVIHLIANCVTSNIRELEGSLVRLLHRQRDHGRSGQGGPERVPGGPQRPDLRGPHTAGRGGGFRRTRREDESAGPRQSDRSRTPGGHVPRPRAYSHVAGAGGGALRRQGPHHGTARSAQDNPSC